MTETEFREVFRSSAIKRTKWRGLVRNACIALGNSVGNSSGASLGTSLGNSLGASLPTSAGSSGQSTVRSADNPARARVIAILERLAGSAEIHVAESAQWALSRIQSQEPEHPVERGFN
jgi:epoxyqueuosine reductase QueG